MLVSKKHIALGNTKSLQKAPELIMVLLKFMAPSAPLKLHYTLNRNICQIHCTWASQVKAASSLLKNIVPIEEWIAATKETKKDCILNKTIPYN